MLDVLDPQRQADADAKGTVIVDVQRGEFLSDDALFFLFGRNRRLEGNNYMMWVSMA